MKNYHAKLVSLLNNMIDAGILGEDIINTRKEFKRQPQGIHAMIWATNVLYESTDGELEECREVMSYFCTLLVAMYADTRKLNCKVADAFLNSFINDYPGVDESCLAPQLSAFMESFFAYKEVSSNENRLLVWQQIKNLCNSYNEFIRALLGFVISCLRVINGKKPVSGVFSQSFRSRLNQMKSLSGGKLSFFYQVERIADTALRNAISHGSIWLDSEAEKVKYIEGSKNKKELEMSLWEFMFKTILGVYLVKGYIAAICALIVLIDGTEDAKSLLPAGLGKIKGFGD